MQGSLVIKSTSYHFKEVQEKYEELNSVILITIVLSAT